MNGGAILITITPFDQARFAAAIECGFLRVTSAEYAYETVRRAFYVARTESRPMMVSAPLDVQMALMDDWMNTSPRRL